jgi:hypothetical protein
MNSNVANISPALRYYRKQALINLSEGKTTKGTTRKYRASIKTTEEREREKQERIRRAWGRTSLCRNLAGLTTRGGERVYRITRPDALILEAEIDAVASLISKHFFDLPSNLKPSIMDLSHHLAAIRRRIES